MEQKTVQSVDRTLSIIECLAVGERELQDLAIEVNLNKSTVHRLLKTLMIRGFVLQDSQTSAYRLSPKFITIGKQLIEDIDVVKIAKSYLSDLNELTGEVIHLVMFDGEEGIYIDKFLAKHNVSMYSYIGKRVSIYSSAVGKAYLAYASEDVSQPLLQRVEEKSTPLTSKTILTKQGMMEALELTIHQGFAIDDEENEEGVICVAAPIFNHLGKVEYAVSISTPTYRLNPEKIQCFGKAVSRTASDISNALGFVAK